MKGGPLVVVGDSLLDVDLHGTVSRVAPDAPVPVVDCQRERHRAAAPAWPPCWPPDWPGPMWS